MSDLDRHLAKEESNQRKWEWIEEEAKQPMEAFLADLGILLERHFKDTDAAWDIAFDDMKFEEKKDTGQWWVHISTSAMGGIAVEMNGEIEIQVTFDDDYPDGPEYEADGDM